MTRKWTEQEEQELKKMYNRNISMVEIATILNRTYGAIRSKAVEMALATKGKMKKRYSVNEDFFTNIDSIEKAYIFGFWCADGCIHENRFDIAQHVKDEYILSNIKEKLEYTGPLKRNGEKGKRLTISSKTLCDSIKNHGGMERKSIVMPMPKIPEKFYFDFLRGYMDGDGTIRKQAHHRNKDIFYLYFQLIGGKNLLCDVQKFIKEKYEVDLSLRIIDKESGFSRLSAQGKKAFMFLDLIYENVNSKKTDLFLKRKYKIYSEMKQLS